MRALIKILSATLGANDPRWLAFGLQTPSTITTPGKPVNVTATLDEAGSILVQWDAVPLAARYRCRMLLVGVETDYRLVARSVDPMATVSGVMPGQKLQIIVQAVNENLQSVPSEPIQFTTPGVGKARTAEPALPALELPVVGERNGSNGHANGSRLPALS